MAQVIINSRGVSILSWRGRTGKVSHEYLHAYRAPIREVYPSLCAFLASEWPGISPTTLINSWEGQAIVITCDHLRIVRKRVADELGGVSPRSIEELMSGECEPMS